MNTNAAHNYGIHAWAETKVEDEEKAELEALITKLKSSSGRHLKPMIFCQRDRDELNTDPYLVNPTSQQSAPAQVKKIRLLSRLSPNEPVATVNLGFVLTIDADRPPVLLLLSSSLAALQKDFGLPFGQVYETAVTAWALSVAKKPGPEECYPAVIVVVDSNEDNDEAKNYIAQRLAALERVSAVSLGERSILGSQFSTDTSYGLDDTQEFSFRKRCIRAAIGAIDFYAIGTEAEDLLQRINRYRSDKVMPLARAMEIVAPHPVQRKKPGFFGRLSGLFGR